MTDPNIEKIRKYVRAANYIAAAQIYLQANFELKERLSFEHIKPRLLGHWGTCPGINFVYAHLQYFVKKTREHVLFVNGVGHGFPALQANLFIEGSLTHFYPHISRDAVGLAYIIRNFSWPYGFPSHSNPAAPGVILEGGELGYSLATAYGAALDNPDLTVVCLVGDGEAETGPLATSWHLNKFVHPRTNGIVLPILHLNGYKISGPTIFGRMSTSELLSLFQGYGYDPIFVEDIPGDDIYVRMIEALDRSYSKIKQIRERARSGQNVVAPTFPMIILKTPKGWSGIRYIGSNRIEGNCLSHQVVVNNAKTDIQELELLEEWLGAYRFSELFDSEKGFIQDILDIIPDDDLKIGLSKYAHFDRQKIKLMVPKAVVFSEDAAQPGTLGSSSMRRTGEYLNEVIKLNEFNRNFRIFSPDETYSNKIDKVFDFTTRAFVWPIMPWDKDISQDGRVIEMLSEHALFGLLQGYVLTGRYGVFISYEAFVQIISSMADQYLKFVKIAREIPWRPSYASLNIILTSSGWRQDHNGFSHQNPGFISGLLEKNDPCVKFYFPPDGNTTLQVLEKALNLENGINVIVAGKTLEPRWLTSELAYRQVEEGIMIWDFASDDNPHLVFCAIGDYMTKEMMAAIDLIKRDLPFVRIRFVNITDLTVVRQKDLDDYFTHDKPVIINFHGYPDSIKKLLFDYKTSNRFDIRGFVENGSTTTPFDMQVRNMTSRWHIVLAAVERLRDMQIISSNEFQSINSKYLQKLNLHKEYIIKNGVDLPEINEWGWRTHNTGSI